MFSNNVFKKNLKKQKLLKIEESKYYHSIMIRKASDVEQTKSLSFHQKDEAKTNTFCLHNKDC